VRLPKGHVETGETVREAALRETAEESGYIDLEIQGDLGEQEVEFDFRDKHVVRLERYFVMRLGPTCLRADGSAADPINPETQFTPEWLSWDQAMLLLSFEPEREWIRRARVFLEEADTG
jgi:ADP-ribose pyrophosphatase YjhB (NUDIX family)